jgi:recombination protein RecT
VNTERTVSVFSQSELDTLKATIAKGTTNEQFALFVQICQSSGLNPFLNQIFCIVYNGQAGPVMSVQIAVEGIMAIAKRNPSYNGFKSAAVYENDEYAIDVSTGEIVHKVISFNRGQCIGAYCVAFRKDAPNTTVVVSKDQVDHLLKGKNANMWKDYFADMIEKHAIKRAFKRQYGIEISEDDYNQAPAPSYENVPRRDITLEVVADVPKVDTTQEEIEKVRAASKVKFRKLGITTKDKMQEFIDSNNVFADASNPTLGELLALDKLLDSEIARKSNVVDDNSLNEAFAPIGE